MATVDVPVPDAVTGRLQGILPAHLPLEAGGGRLGRPQGRLLALALGNVARDTIEADDGPFGIAQGGLGGEIGALATEQGKLLLQVEEGLAGQHAAVLCLERRGDRGREQFLIAVAQELLDRQAQVLGAGLIRQEIAAREILGEEGVGGAGEDGVQQLAGLLLLAAQSLLALPGDGGAPLPVPAPEAKANGMEQDQCQQGGEGQGQGQFTELGVGLLLVDLGEQDPGRAGDGGRVAQDRYPAMIQCPFDDAALALRRHDARLAGPLAEGPLFPYPGLVQGDEKAHRVALAPRQGESGTVDRGRLGRQHGMQRLRQVPGERGHPQGRPILTAHRHQHAQAPDPVGTRPRVETFEPRAAQEVPHPLRRHPRRASADLHQGLAPIVVQGQAVPVALPGDRLQSRAQPAQQGSVPPVAGDPILQQQAGGRGPGEECPGIAFDIHQPMLDRRALLLGNAGQGAGGLVADPSAEDAIGPEA